MTPKSPAHKLKELKQILRKARKGYRFTKYETFQETMENVVKLKSDPMALKEFAEQAHLKPKKLKALDTNWIASAAFTFVIGNEQQGWKAARVAEFLHDFKGVPVKDLAEQIRKLGGIEKIVKLAAKEDPKRAKPLGDIKKRAKARCATKTTPFNAANVSEERGGDVIDDSEDWETPILDDDDHDDRDQSRVTVRISPVLRAKLLAIETDRRVNLIGARIDSDDPIEIQEVRQLRK